MKQLTDDTLQVVVFRVANETYAVPVHDVESIIRYTSETSVPEAPMEIRGVMDIRGRLISIYDLRTRFHLGPLEDESQANVLVLREDVRDVGLLVDAVSEVATVAVSDSQPAPAEATAMGNDFILGVIHHGEELVMLLDLLRLLGVTDVASESYLAAAEAAHEAATAEESVPASV